MSAMAGPAWSCVRGGGLGWPAWVNTNAYHYTSAFRDYEERRRQTEIYIQLVCFELLSYNKWWVMYACCRSFITHSASFLHPSSPPCPVASGRFHRHYWNVDTEDDVTKLSGTERGAEIIDGGGGQRWGRMVVGGRYLAYFSLLVSRSAGSRHWLLRAWIWMLRLVLLLSVSVWLQLPRTRWCHSQGFVNILDKETKSRGRAQRCQSVNRSKNYTTPLYGWVDFYCL